MFWQVGVHREARPRGGRDHQRFEEAGHGGSHPPHDHREGDQRAHTQEEEGQTEVDPPHWNRHSWGELICIHL